MLRKTILGALLLFLLHSNTAEAKKPGFISFGGETIIKIADFPDTDTYQSDDGEYVDAGCIFKQFSIMFIPLWNYDIRWCGYTGQEDSYIIIDKETLDELAKEAGVTLPAEPSLPFWYSIGGKLLFIAIIGAFIAYSILSPDEEEEENAEENPAATVDKNASSKENDTPDTPKNEKGDDVTP